MNRRKNYNITPEFVGIDELRFWSKVHIGKPDECWPWIGSKIRKDGYAKFGVGAQHSIYAHRVAYFLAVGKIPKDFVVDHVAAKGCFLKSCCNPSHLDAISQTENVHRYHLLSPSATHCRKCGRVKQYRFPCQSCRNEYHRLYAASHRDRINAISAKSYAKLHPPFPRERPYLLSTNVTGVGKE